MKRVSSIIAWVFLVLLFAAALGLVAFVFAGGLDETFLVRLDGERLTSHHTEKIFLRGKTYRFDVGYLLSGGEQAEAHDYNVKIVANQNAEIEFFVDGEPYAWQGEEEITKAFVLDKTAAGFTLALPKELTFQTVAESLYPQSDVSAPPEYDVKQLCPYTLLISSYDEKTVYAIDFNLCSEAYAIARKVVPESYAQYVNLRCPQEAQGGDRVEFSFYHGKGVSENAPSMVLEGVFLITGDDAEHAEEVYCSLQFIYSFDMPFSDVTIEFRFIPE